MKISEETIKNLENAVALANRDTSYAWLQTAAMALEATARDIRQEVAAEKMREIARSEAALCKGARVHVYKSSHYNKRGEIVEVRATDALGRFTVKLNVSNELIQCHQADLELVP